MKWEIGNSGEFSKTITESDVIIFAGISGDLNPVHINEVEASKSRFGKRIVHGALVSSYISTVLGMYMPGPGTIYLEQSSKYICPVYIGDTLTAKVQIVAIEKGNRARLSTVVVNQNKKIVVEGEAKVILPQCNELTSCE